MYEPNKTFGITTILDAGYKATAALSPDFKILLCLSWNLFTILFYLRLDIEDIVVFKFK